MNEKKSTLHDLTGMWLDLYQMADDPDMESEVQTWFDTIEALEGEIEDKADGYAKVMLQLNADAELLKKEEQRLHARRSTIENRIKAMKARLQETMQLTGKTKFKTTLFSYNIQKNPPSLVIDKEELIPQGYYIPQPPVLARDAIKDFLKTSTETVEWAHLEQTESLRIR